MYITPTVWLPPTTHLSIYPPSQHPSSLLNTNPPSQHPSSLLPPAPWAPLGTAATSTPSRPSSICPCSNPSEGSCHTTAPCNHTHYHQPLLLHTTTTITTPTTANTLYLPRPAPATIRRKVAAIATPTMTTITTAIITTPITPTTNQPLVLLL